MSEYEKYFEQIREEYLQIMEKFVPSQEPEEKARLRHLIKTMGFHGKLSLDYDHWLEDCIAQKDWPGMCNLIDQQIRHMLMPHVYGGYTHENGVWHVLDSFACGDHQIIESALPPQLACVTNCLEPFYLPAAHMLMTLWYKDETLAQTAVPAAEAFLQKKKSPQREKAVVAFLLDLYTGDTAKASRDLQEVCQGYSRIQSKRRCIYAHGLYCLAQLILPKEDFDKIQLPECRNFSRDFALWRREHQPDLAPYILYPEDLKWLNEIYAATPATLIMNQPFLNDTNARPKQRREWMSDGMAMVNNFVEALWNHQV